MSWRHEIDFSGSVMCRSLCILAIWLHVWDTSKWRRRYRLVLDASLLIRRRLGRGVSITLLLGTPASRLVLLQVSLPLLVSALFIAHTDTVLRRNSTCTRDVGIVAIVGFVIDDLGTAIDQFQFTSKVGAFGHGQWGDSIWLRGGDVSEMVTNDLGRVLLYLS